MPSHIFTRQGLWEESIEMNRRSAATSKSHFDSLHAMDYLEYAYLQGARDGEAKRVLNEIAAIKKVDREHFVTAYALAAIPARYALERERWADAASLLPYPNERDLPWPTFRKAWPYRFMLAPSVRRAAARFRGPRGDRKTAKAA